MYYNVYVLFLSGVPAWRLMQVYSITLVFSVRTSNSRLCELRIDYLIERMGEVHNGDQKMRK